MQNLPELLSFHAIFSGFQIYGCAPLVGVAALLVAAKLGSYILGRRY